MGLINKTRITENISVVIGHREIFVSVTENFPFDIKIGFQKVEEELKAKDKQHKELKTLFAFAKANKKNWFETALFDGVLSEKVKV
jgi:hypothetical protein